ncbi:ComF family protein [Candidatus Saccharibacteria bacterium]|nr:ComF family protein [Candidatus Saccharibacteria bacterium]
MVGWRDELVFKLVEEFKYHSVRALGEELADLLDGVLPEVAGEVVVVPLPTIRSHVRERGFDHMLKIAKSLAKKRGWKVERILKRAKNTVQVGANREVRLVQAAGAYELAGTISPDKTYLVLDDVWTTGASMKIVTKKLQRAGALKVLLAVLAVNRGNPQ